MKSAKERIAQKQAYKIFPFGEKPKRPRKRVFVMPKIKCGKALARPKPMIKSMIWLDSIIFYFVREKRNAKIPN